MGSTNSKKPNEPWNKNETNFRPLLKRLKLLSKLKKPRFFDSPLKCPNPNRTLSEDWLKKKKKSITPDETVSELLNPCKPTSQRSYQTSQDAPRCRQRQPCQV